MRLALTSILQKGVVVLVILHMYQYSHKTLLIFFCLPDNRLQKRLAILKALFLISVQQPGYSNHPSDYKKTLGTLFHLKCNHICQGPISIYLTMRGSKFLKSAVHVM